MRGRSADVGVTNIVCTAVEVDDTDAREVLSTWQTYLECFQIMSRMAANVDLRSPVPLNHPHNPTSWVLLFLCSGLLRDIKFVHQSVLCGFSRVLVVFHVRIVRVIVP